MARVFACGVLTASVLAVLHTAAQQEPSFKQSSDVVRVFATVTDRDGRLVTTLTRDQFEVRDEGKLQSISQFDNTPQPIRLVVMLDVSSSMAGHLPRLRGAADQLFARLHPDDVARVGSFGHGIIISPSFTREASELRAALPQRIAPHAPTPLWHAIAKALDTFGEPGDTRRVILVLSDGQDTGGQVRQAEVINRARRDDVMIYAVGIRGRTRQAPPIGTGRDNLQALTADRQDPLALVAEETGGGYVELRLGDDLGSVFAGVADELHSQYLLGFELPKRDGKVHDISVRVSVGGLKARARKSYRAPR